MDNPSINAASLLFSNFTLVESDKIPFRTNISIIEFANSYVSLLIISICALIDILSPGVLAVTAYLLLTQPNQLSSRLLVFLFITQFGYFVVGLLLYFGGDSLLKGIGKLSEFDFMSKII